MIEFAKKFIDDPKVSAILREAIEVNKEYYYQYPLLRNALHRIGKKPQFAGLYLGKIKNGAFKPSPFTLKFLADESNRKIIVSDKAAWLFICGRDVLSKGIFNSMMEFKDGDFALILNKREECLGYGEIVLRKNKIARVKNIYDIGDFLRRE